MSTTWRPKRNEHLHVRIMRDPTPLQSRTCARVCVLCGHTFLGRRQARYCHQGDCEDRYQERLALKSIEHDRRRRKAYAGE